MKENYGGYEEYEVRLIDLFWSVLRHWRGLIVGMIVFGILVGLFGAVKEYRKYTDPVTKAKMSEEYTEAMEQYNRSKDAYEAKIDNLTQWIGRLDSYKESSLMLLMDPYNIHRSTITYYIDTGYEIMPGVSYQNPDYTAALISSYAATIARLPFDDLIDLPGGPDLNTAHTVNKYLSKKVCTVDSDPANGLLTVTVISDTVERSEVLLNAVREAMIDNEALLTEVMGEHSVSIIGETSERTLDLDLANLQTAFTNDYESNSTELTKTQEALKALEEPVKTVHSRRTIVKQGIKYGIIGAVIGLILTALLYIFRNHDQSIHGMSLRFGIPVLGVLNSSGSTPPRIDRRIVTKLGVTGLDDADHAAAYLSSAITVFDNHPDESILFIGCAADEKLQQVINAVSLNLPARNVIYGGDIRNSAKAVDELSGNCEIICVETWPGFRNNEIERELDILRSLGKKPMGFILVF